MLEDLFAGEVESVDGEEESFSEKVESVDGKGKVESIDGKEKVTLSEDNRKKVEALRRCFAPMYPADAVVRDEELKGVLADVMEHPNHYVLKPQREGGGYNIWGNDIVETLKRKDM